MMRKPLDIDLAVRCIRALKERGKYEGQLVGLPVINFDRKARFSVDRPILYFGECMRGGISTVIVQRPNDPNVVGDGRLTTYRLRFLSNYIKPVNVDLG